MSRIYNIGCLHPIQVVNPWYRSSKSTWSQKESQARADYHLLVPCGHCIACRRKRSSMWHFRLYQEALHTPTFQIGSKSYLNIWFVTFTFNDKHLPDLHSDTLRSDLAPYIRKWRDNWRKRFGVSPRYFCVTDVGGDRGRLHLHLLIFNPTYRDGRRISISSVFDLNTDDPHKQLEWRYGFCTYCSFVRGLEAIHYVSGYINNENALRTQTKHGKPLCFDALRHIPVTFCSQGLGLKFIFTNTFKALKRAKSVICRLGSYIYAVPRYYKLKYFESIPLGNGSFITPEEQLSALTSRYCHSLIDQDWNDTGPAFLKFGKHIFHNLEQLERFRAQNDKVFGRGKIYEYKKHSFTFVDHFRAEQQDLFFKPLI